MSPKRPIEAPRWTTSGRLICCSLCCVRAPGKILFLSTYIGVICSLHTVSGPFRPIFARRLLAWLTGAFTQVALETVASLRAQRG